MAITIEATYEDGVLKPAEPLPLKEHEKVRVTLEAELSLAQQTAVMLRWSGDAETFDRLFNESEGDRMKQT